LHKKSLFLDKCIWSNLFQTSELKEGKIQEAILVLNPVQSSKSKNRNEFLEEGTLTMVTELDSEGAETGGSSERRKGAAIEIRMKMEITQPLVDSFHFRYKAGFSKDSRIELDDGSLFMTVARHMTGNFVLKDKNGITVFKGKRIIQGVEVFKQQMQKQKRWMKMMNLEPSLPLQVNVATAKVLYQRRGDQKQ
jgi:hypothetical protein